MASISEAFYRIGECDTILVRAGEYVEDVQAVRNCFNLIAESGAASTAIVGGISTGHVENTLTIFIRGFTIRQGFGVFISTAFVGNRVTIRECVIEDNDKAGVWSGDGGGVYSHAHGLPFGGAYGTIIDSCVIRSNRARDGAGVWIHHDATIRNSVVVDNLATRSAGGIYLDGSETGGRKYVQMTTIAGNTAEAGPAGGLHVTATSLRRRLVMENTIVALNHGGYGVFCSGIGDSAHASCSDVWGNTSGAYGGDCADPTGTNGNLSLDPRFCNPVLGDYRLAEDSPCAPGQSPPGCGLIGDLPVGCAVSSVPAPPLLTGPLPLLRVAPNPFTAETIVILPGQRSSGELVVFDPLGRYQATIPPTGRELDEVIWRWTGVDGDGDRLPAGIYLLVAREGSRPVAVGRAILLAP